MEAIGLFHVLTLSGILFSLGVVGVLTRKNILIVFMSVELMLNAVNLSFVAFARETGQADGHLFSAIVMAVAAAEAAVGLALVILLYRNRLTVHLDELDIMKG